MSLLILVSAVISNSSNALAAKELAKTETRASFSPGVDNLQGGNEIITLPVSGSLCYGSTVVVNFEAGGVSFDPGNVFTAQLSDENGDFSNPISIGTLSLAGPVDESLVYALIPSGLPAGTNYRIRVNSSSPSITGIQTGAGITINTLIAPPIPTVNLNGPTAFCFGSATTFISSSSASGNLWFPGGVNTNPFIGVVDPGCYYTQVTGVNGWVSSSVPVCIEVNDAIFTFLGYYEDNTLVTTADTTVTVCEGDSAQIGILIQGGTPPFDIFYTPDGFNFETVTDVGTLIPNSEPATYQYTFFTGTPGFYQVIGITDNFPTNCGSNGNSGLVTIQTAPRPVTDFSYAPFCGPLSGAPITVAEFETGGVYSFESDPGDGAQINPESGVISNAVIGATYNIVYTVQGDFCESSSSTSVTVNTSDITDFTIEPFCSSNDSEAPQTVLGFAPGGTYSFAAAPGDAATINSQSGIISNASGNTTYTVTYTSPEGVCQASSNTDVTTLESPIVDGTVVNTICADAIGSIQATASAGLPEYSYLWSNGAETSSITGLVAGAYTVTVTDENGCADDSTFTIINTDEPEIELVATDASCSANSGSIDLNITGGSGDFSFIWTPGGETTQNITGLAEGSYSVEVTDNVTTCVVNGSASIENADAPEASAVVVNSLCNESIGSITVTIVPGTGTGEISYLWSNGATSSAITNLSSGSYTVTITDEGGCEVVLTESVIDENQFQATPSTINPTCANPSAGEISIDIENGTEPFQFVWSPNTAETSSSATGLTSGDYTIIITDAATCEQTVQVSLAPVNAITLELTGTNSTCENSDGAIDLTVLGGSGTYIYEWSNGTDQEDLLGVPEGDYTVTVTDQTDNSCVAVGSFEVTNSNEPEILVEVTPSGCIEPTGAINITVTEGTGDYSFAWSGPNGFASSDEDISNLNAGTYNLILNDNTSGCEVTATGVISLNNPPVIAATTANTTCGQSNGIIDITIQGGTSPVDFEWSDNANASLDRINLPAGNYTLTLTDANGCTDDSTFTVAPSVAITADLAFVNPTCANDTGSIELTISNVTNPVTFNWTLDGAPFANTQNLENLAPGVYSVLVNDANGCTANASATLIYDNQPELELTAEGTICGLATGSIDLTVNGGIGPFVYSWEGPDDFTAATEDISLLALGCYDVTVNDQGSGCVVTGQACVENLNAPLIEFTTTNASCNLDNGVISFTVSNGQDPYTFVWEGDATTENSFSNLAAGTYTLLVTDANGCETEDSATITNTGIPVVNANQENTNCGGASTGSIELLVSGGLAPYSYLWTPGGETTVSLADLAAGTYSVLITDAALCEITAEFTIEESDGPEITFTSISPACGSNNGSIDLIVNGGSGDYSFEWTGESVNANSEDQSGLSAGAFTVVVTDNVTSCESELTITLTESNAFTVDEENSSIIGTTCGLDNGSASIELIGGTAPFNFVWCNGQNAASATDLAAGTCLISISDAAGCQLDYSIEVPSSTAPSVDGTVTPVTCGACDGAIELNFTDAAAPLSILWNNGSTSQTLSQLCSGDYSAEITDANGCVLNYATTIAAASEPIIVIEPGTVDSSLCGQFNGAIDVSISGGLEPYTIAWTGPNGFTNNIDQDITGLEAGVYELSVTDAGGCQSEVSVTIVNSDEPELSFVVTPAGCGSATGEIQLVLDGGEPDATVVWSGPNGYNNAGPATTPITGLEAGTYVAVVTSGNCIVTGSADVINADGPTATISISDTVICEGSTVSVSILLQGDAPFSFTYNDGQDDITVNAFTSNVFSFLDSPQSNTTYSLISIISDLNPSCQGSFPVASVSVVVNPTPEQPVITANGSLSFCEGGSVVLTSSASSGNIWNQFGPDQFNQSITVTESGSYFVTVENGFACVDSSDVIEVVVTPLPQLNAGADTTVCAGSPIFFNPGDADDYLWSPSIYLSGTIIANPVCIPFETTTYTVTGSNVCGTSTDTIVVTVSPIIDVNLGDDLSACPGDTLNFAVESADDATYMWTSTGSLVSENNESEFSTIVSSQTTITVMATGTNGCVSTDTLLVNINAVPQAPSITALGNTTFCEGESVILQANTGNFVVWSNGLENFDEILVTEAGDYYVTSINGICPSTSDTITITVNPLPFTEISSEATTACEGECVTLQANDGASPVWTNPDGITANESIIEACQSGVYILSNTQNGCTGVDTVQITIVPTPEPPVISLDGPITICADQTTTLVSSYATGNQWLAEGVEIQGATDNTLVVNVQGSFSVQVTNSLGCTAVSEPIFITVKPVSPLSILANPDTIVCGNIPVAVELTASAGFVSYTWSPQGDSQTIIANSAGTWSVIAFNQDGCSSEASISIIVAPAIEVEVSSPVLYDNFNVSVVGGNDGSIDLSISGQGSPSGVSWSGPNGFTSNQEDLFNLFAGFYTVTVSDEFGCEIQDTITLIEPGDIKLPNGFTPNGDGFNDFYVIKGIQGYPENQVNIFNRWGNLVFSSKGYTNNWQGNSNDGNVLPDGTYFIVVDLNKEGKDDIQGFIDLRRK